MRPRSPVEVIDAGFDLVKSDPIVLAVTAAIVVPVELVAAWLNRDLLAAGFDGVIESIWGASGAGGGDQRTTASVVWSLTAGSLVLPLTAAALGRLVVGWHEDRRPRFGATMVELGRLSWAVALAWLLVHLVEAAGLVTCGIGSLYAMTRYSVTAPALAIERIGPIAAMKRSWRLVRGRSAEVFWACILVGLVTIVIEGSLTVLPEAFGVATGVDPGWVTTAVVSVAVSVLTTAVVASCAVVQYLDLRCRHEGLDIELRVIEQMGPAPR